MAWGVAMKVVGRIVVVLLVLLAPGLLGAMHFGIAVPWLGDLSKLGDVSIPVALVLLLFGVVAGTMLPATGREGPWTAVGAIASVAMAATAVITVLDQQKHALEEQERLTKEQKRLASEQTRSVDVETLRLFVELEKTRPPNTRFCRCALLRLLGPEEAPQFASLLKREPVPLSDGVRGVREMMLRCLSDVSETERKEFIADDQAALTNRGTSFFADRVSRILNLDDDVAFAVNAGLARKEMVTASLFQSLAVANAIAIAYEKRLKFKGFPNVQAMELPPLGAVCEEPTGLASTK